MCLCDLRKSPRMVICSWMLRPPVHWDRERFPHDRSETANAMEIQVLRSDHCLSSFTQSIYHQFIYHQLLSCDLSAQLAWDPEVMSSGPVHTLLFLTFS